MAPGVAHCEAMSREFLDIVDPWKVAEGRRTFAGTMPLDRMPRLVGLLAAGDDDGAEIEKPQDVSFSASFRFDRQGLVTIDVTVKADLPLVCQRSLRVYKEHVDRRSRLAVIETVADEEALPEHYEPVLVEDRRLALAELVEEELLLAVPQVPRDPEFGDLPVPESVSVEASTGKEQEKTHRPFEGLAGLMKESAGD